MVNHLAWRPKTSRNQGGETHAASPKLCVSLLMLGVGRTVRTKWTQNVDRNTISAPRVRYGRSCLILCHLKWYLSTSVIDPVTQCDSQKYPNFGCFWPNVVYLAPLCSVFFNLKTILHPFGPSPDLAQVSCFKIKNHYRCDTFYKIVCRSLVFFTYITQHWPPVRPSFASPANKISCM